jgi:hypothetical protein
LSFKTTDEQNVCFLFLKFGIKKIKNMDKYQETLASSQVNADDAVVAAEVKKIVEKAGQYANSDVYQFLFSSIDLTTLSTTDTQTSVAQFVKRVNDFDNDYPQFKNVAAICVYSNFAEIVRSNLEVSGVDIAVVNRFIKQFEQSQKMMKQLPGMMGGLGKKGRMRFPF